MTALAAILWFKSQEESSALRDFVYETNRGNQVWFVADQEELEKRLGIA
jgi:hypothetical protein